MRLFLICAAAIVASACSTDPTCSAADTPYDFCSNEEIWTCPTASQADIDAKNALLEPCGTDIVCISEVDLPQFPAQLSVDCAAASQVCLSAMESEDGIVECADE